MSEHAPAAFWDRRYAERDRIWSGEANQALVATVSGLRPGRALDLGCGEGGDSVWLTRQGWRVTAVDIAATAIARAKKLAASHAVPDGRITWVVDDLGSWQPDGSYDLVSACFLQSPIEFPRTAVLRRAASAVAPRGHLLVVSHAEPPPWAKGHHHAPHRFPSPAEELVGLQLPHAGWETVISETRPRQAAGPDGEEETLRDTVILAYRRP
jgi:SAM-dependent methyltransferase